MEAPDQQQQQHPQYSPGDLIEKAEAAAYLGTSERSIERHVAANRLAAIEENVPGRTRKRVLFRVADLDTLRAPIHRPVVERVNIERLSDGEIDATNSDTSSLADGAIVGTSNGMSSSGISSGALPGTLLVTPEMLVSLVEGAVRVAAREMAAQLPQVLPQVLPQLPGIATGNDNNDGNTDKALPTVPIEQRAFLSIEESAQYVGVGPSAIEAALKSGALVAHKGLARGRRIKRADLDTWAKAL